VNVVDAPEQIVWLGVAILTEGVTVPLTFIVSEFDVAVVGEAHDELDVMTHVTTAPLVSVVDVYVALLVPTLVPLTFH
jgi:hypothetical protein